MTVVRGTLVLVSLLAAAWFALAVRQARDYDRAKAIVNQSSPLTAGQVQRATSLLDAAGQLNPDREVTMLRAQLALDQNRRVQAEALLVPVIRAEPENVVAWLFVAQAARSAAAFRLAVARIGHLMPKVPNAP
jgi:predicted Zn-dependent protease